jgi:putative FmdB family regulatory protein
MVFNFLPGGNRKGTTIRVITLRKNKNNRRLRRMPIYEYKCNNCQRVIEVMQKFSDKPLTRCPACSGRITRIISNCSFHLKGTGWYVTDYKKKDAGWKDKGAEAKKDDPPKSETPTESKPETKTS